MRNVQRVATAAVAAVLPLIVSASAASAGPVEDAVNTGNCIAASASFTPGGGGGVGIEFGGVSECV